MIITKIQSHCLKDGSILETMTQIEREKLGRVRKSERMKGGQRVQSSREGSRLGVAETGEGPYTEVMRDDAGEMAGAKAP